MQVKGLQECKEEVLALCAEKHCNPILVRLAWHDAGKTVVVVVAAAVVLVVLVFMCCCVCLLYTSPSPRD